MAVSKMKSIRDTYLYSVVNKNGEFDKLIGTFMQKAVVATPDMLKTQYGTIQQYFNFPSKNAVMEHVKEGLVVPMLYPKGITATNKIPTNLPFILTKDKSGRGVRCIAVIDNWATIGDKVVTIDTNKLYTFLEGAYVARGLQLGFNGIVRNTVIYNEACSIYAHMFARVLNREYALNVDKDAFNKVLFLASKFFLVNLLGMDKDSDLVFNYACKAAGNISPIAIKRLNDAMGENAYDNIAKFIEALAANGYMIIAGLNELTVREYIEKYIRMYHNSSLFALEHLSYFIFSIMAVVNRAHINEVYAWEAAIGQKSGEKLYAHIINAVSHY